MASPNIYFNYTVSLTNYYKINKIFLQTNTLIIIGDHFFNLEGGASFLFLFDKTLFGFFVKLLGGFF